MFFKNRSKESEFLSGKIKINGQWILGSQDSSQLFDNQWSKSIFKRMLWAHIGKESYHVPITEILLEEINCTPRIFHELLETILDGINEDTGVTSLHFSKFPSTIDQIDAMTLSRFYPACLKLTSLSICDMQD